MLATIQRILTFQEILNICSFRDLWKNCLGTPMIPLDEAGTMRSASSRLVPISVREPAWQSAVPMKGVALSKLQHLLARLDRHSPEATVRLALSSAYASQLCARHVP